MATLVRHPNVAALYDFSRLPDGSYYMVWEFIDGVTLEEWMRRHGPLPLSQALDVVAAGPGGARRDPRAGNRAPGPLARQHPRAREPGRAARRQDHRPRHRQARGGRVARDDGDRSLPRASSSTARRSRPERSLPERRWTGGATSTPSASCSTRCWRGARRSSRRLPRATSASISTARHRRSTRRGLPAGTGPALASIVMRALEKDRDRRFSSAGEFAAALERIGPASAEPVGTLSSDGGRPPRQPGTSPLGRGDVACGGGSGGFLHPEQIGIPEVRAFRRADLPGFRRSDRRADGRP